jgi:uncharacterized membrane protein YhaH (DUF805 family)
MVKILTSLFLPTGRGSRPEMLLAAVVMLTAEALLMALGAQLNGYVAMAIKGIVLWIGMVVTIRRLHDLGHSAWWVLSGAAFLCMWGTLILLSGLFFLGREVLIPGSIFHLVILSLTLLPALGMALWLHLAPGEPHRNRYGLPTQSPRPAPIDGTQTAQSQDMGLAR